MDITDWDSVLKVSLTALAIFCVIGGIVSQTSGGASGRGFMEGVWKGVEWWFIGVVALGIFIGVWYVIAVTANQLNTTL